MPQPKNTFTNSRGYTVKIQAVNPWLLAEVEKSNEAAYGKPSPKPPTYQVELLGGTKETHAHDETTLTTEEDKVAWAAYISEKYMFDNFKGERLSRVIFSEGIVTGALPQEWKKRVKFLGIPLPEDEEEQKVLFGKTQGTAQDTAALLTAIMGLSGVPAEALGIAEDTFRRAMEAGDGAAPQGIAPAGESLVSQPAPHGIKNRKGVGKNPK